MELKNFIFWSATVRVLIEGCFGFILDSFTQISYGLYWGSTIQVILSLEAVILVSIYIVGPIMLSIYLYFNRESYDKTEFKNKLGEVTEVLNKDNSLSSSHVALFCYRRMMIGVMVVFLDTGAYSQIILLVHLNLTVVIITICS